MAEYKINHNFGSESLFPEQKARVKIDTLLNNAGWTVVSRDEFSEAINAQAVKENLMKGNLEADYILYLDGKAIAVLEAKREESNLGLVVAEQAQNYADILPDWIQAWKTPLPFIFLSNGNTLLFKDMHEKESKYKELKKMLTQSSLWNLPEATLLPSTQGFRLFRRLDQRACARARQRQLRILNFHSSRERSAL